MLQSGGDRHGERSRSPRGDIRDGRGDMRQTDIDGHLRDTARDMPRDLSGMSRGSDVGGDVLDDASTHSAGKRERDANDSERSDKGFDKEKEGDRETADGDWPADKRPCVDGDVRKEQVREVDHDCDASAPGGVDRVGDRDGDRSSDGSDVGAHGGAHGEGQSGMPPQMGGSAPLPPKRMGRVPGHLIVEKGLTEAVTPSDTPRASIPTPHFHNSVPPHTHANTESTRPPSPPGLPPDGADRFPVVWRGSVVSICEHQFHVRFVKG